MTEQLIVRQEAGPEGGRLVLAEPNQGKALGVLTFRWVDGVMHVDHSEIAIPLRGKGLGQTLVLDAIRRARAEGFRIEPHCGYVRHVMDQMGDALSDVRA